jgi:hypothetical protein
MAKQPVLEEAFTEDLADLALSGDALASAIESMDQYLKQGVHLSRARARAAHVLDAELVDAYHKGQLTFRRVLTTCHAFEQTAATRRGK